MPYAAKDYTKLLGMEGFSDALLNTHFTLYQGYVTNTNKVLELTASLANEGKAATPEFAELKRRLGWEFNGMRLHEFYFDNLGGKDSKLEPSNRLGQALAAEFGSVEKWEADFRATGAMRGIGWAVLYQDVAGGRFFNSWINEHDTGHPAGQQPLLVMDVFEHAFMHDYGTKRADYIAAFFKNVDWASVAARMK